MTTPISSDDVREAYDGVEARLYELMMGELLHLGGLISSLELVERPCECSFSLQTSRR